MTNYLSSLFAHSQRRGGDARRPHQQGTRRGYIASPQATTYV